MTGMHFLVPCRFVQVALEIEMGVRAKHVRAYSTEAEREVRGTSTSEATRGARRGTRRDTESARKSSNVFATREESLLAAGAEVAEKRAQSDVEVACLTLMNEIYDRDHCDLPAFDAVCPNWPTNIHLLASP